MSAPQSLIRVLGVPLNNRYEHTYYFQSKAEQSAFFASKVVKTFSAYTFLRKSWNLQVQTTMEQADSWKYLTFRNVTNGKDYYYFITNIEYINENNVRLSLELDVMQTYMFDYGLGPCFVDRQHTESDDIGEHTVDEGLELGTLYNAHSYHMEALMDMCILIMSTLNLDTFYSSEGATANMAGGILMDRVFTGFGVYAINPTEWLNLRSLLNSLDTEGKTDAIMGIWMYPKNLVKLKTGQVWDDLNPFIKTVEGVETEPTYLAHFTNYQGNLFQGYTPRNNKLYCYPFNFMYVSNNSGGCAEYRYEFMESLVDGNYPFDIQGAIGLDATVRLFPRNYNGVAGNVEEGIGLGSFPTCAWNSDVYKVWLAQNQATQELTIRNGIVTAGMGALTAIGGAFSANLPTAVGGMVTAYHGLTQVQGVMAQRQDMSVQPPQAKGNHSATVNVASNTQTFTIYYKTLRREFARQIDDYFTRYGYAIKRVQVPNIYARERYTYVKTIGCHVLGDLCADDMAKIANIYDNGITFWADKTTYGYFGENSVLI